MKIFISWSGDRSRFLAGALRDWLAAVIQAVEPWMSDEDIEPGQQWLTLLSEKLSEYNFGILCLTPENISAPWVLFEAGALSKSVGKTRVVPLLLDLDAKDVGFPLAAFQAKSANQKGIRELINSINGLTLKPLDSHAIERVFEALWPQLDEQLKSIPRPRTVDAEPHRSEEEILEELVNTIRRLEYRVEKNYAKSRLYGENKRRTSKPDIYECN